MTLPARPGRPLPGWGTGLRRTQKTALMLATFAGLALSGCTSAAAPVGVAGAPTAGVNSGPARLRGALALALRHLDLVPRTASQPFHLVAFQGQGLDESGATVPAGLSDWEFTFSRYADGGPAQRYEVVSVSVPGTGATRISMKESTDAALSPIENWDGALDLTAPDSPDLLAYAKAKGASVAGAAIRFTSGKVRIEAGGKVFQYNPIDGDYSTL